ncbi:hypothetical protein COCNU_contig69589581G000010 [Cocos nucifera]|nr:hypothetical protein [Cocos nucifera]
MAFTFVHLIGLNQSQLFFFIHFSICRSMSPCTAYVLISPEDVSSRRPIPTIRGKSVIEHHLTDFAPAVAARREPTPVGGPPPPILSDNLRLLDSFSRSRVASSAFSDTRVPFSSLDVSHLHPPRAAWPRSHSSPCDFYTLHPPVPSFPKIHKQSIDPLLLYFHPRHFLLLYLYSI